MTPLQVIFLITAAVTLVAALAVVTRQNLVHAALFLVLSLFGVAVFFVLLEAEFLAVVQVIVYIGAIAILMIFAVMLTRKVASDDTVAANRNAGWAGLIAAGLFFILVIMLSAWSGFYTQAAELSRPGVDTADLGQAMLVELGEHLVSPQAYVIPFEVASVLLLAALIGSLVIAWPRIKKEA
ncbi:MAG: NADH-quinone oxidoreductase subunit J [Anaerolineae bacterium]|nr:NADH-quinone oxidoreductase subunit J [Anaerolineae bacterium]